MSNFYAHVCKNGHVKIDYKRVRETDRCKICGEKMMDTCPACGEIIKVWHYYGSVILGPKKYDLPDNCRFCGAPFPWAGKTGGSDADK